MFAFTFIQKKISR